MDFLSILRRMAASGLEFVIVGGVASRLYGSSRLTYDLDVVPKLEPLPWARLVRTLWEAGARPRIPESQEAIADLEKVRQWIDEKGMLALAFRSADGAVEVDLLVAEARRVDGLLARATAVELDGQTYRIAALDDLIEMKQRAGRPRDLLDVEELKRIRARIDRD